MPFLVVFVSDILSFVYGIIETANHFRCIDEVIESAKSQLSEKFIKHLHFILKNGASDARKDWFAVCDYKKAAE